METITTHKAFGGQQGIYRHLSSTLDCEMELSLYLPPQAEKDDVPVLFYLSGLTCTQDNVTTKSGFQRYAAQHGLAVVCPDTSPRGSYHHGEHDAYDLGSGAGFYVDATQAPWSENYYMFNYISQELVQLIPDHFPLKTTHMGLFGHSMGGHGALVIGLRQPELFHSISAFAPIVEPSKAPWGIKAFNAYLGEDQATWLDYDATALIQAGHRSPNRILIDQGGGDDFLTDQLQPTNFIDACRQGNQALEHRMHAGYDHSYYFIASFMADHMAHHAKILQAL